MILEGWQKDAAQRASYRPADTPVAQRVGQLLHEVSPQGIEVNATIFEGPAARVPLPVESFFVVDRLQLSMSQTALGRMALNLPGVAFVAHGEGLPSVLTLPTHDADKQCGNASILLHELEHVTEKKQGLSMMPIGIRERRAYQTNQDILTALDGSDFQRYIDTWPVDFTHTPALDRGVSSASLAFRDDICPEPPRETFAYDMWKEDGMSRQTLQSVGRAAVFEQLTLGVDEILVTRLADTIYS